LFLSPDRAEHPDDYLWANYTILISVSEEVRIIRKNRFWLSDEQWARIEPHLPTDVRGVERADDRRVISGIVHVLRCGCLEIYGPPTTICNRFVRWAPWHLGKSVQGTYWERTIHGHADAKGRLIAILLTGGEVHDCPAAERLIRRVKSPKRMLGDKAYDSAELREELDKRGTRPVIPNRSNRKQPLRFSKRLYKLRWRVEAAFNRLKDFRRIATRYDRLVRNYLASV
jgi:transposase